MLASIQVFLVKPICKELLCSIF